MDTLELKLTCDNEGIQFYDFLVNDISLYEKFQAYGVSCLSTDTMEEYKQKLVKMLCLDEVSTLPSGRVPIYVCHLCGDELCGGISVLITETRKGFIWEKFERFSYDIGNDNIYFVFDDIKFSGEFEFDKTEYRKILQVFCNSQFDKNNEIIIEGKNDPKSKFIRRFFDHIRSMVAAYSR